MEISAAVEQQLDHRRMTLGHGPHQRRLVLGRLSSVHLGPTGHQRPHGRDAPGAGTAHQQRLARADRGGRVGAGCQQHLDHRRVRVLARQVQRCHTELVRHTGIGAGTDQQTRCREIVPIGGPM